MLPVVEIKRCFSAADEGMCCQWWRKACFSAANEDMCCQWWRKRKDAFLQLMKIYAASGGDKVMLWIYLLVPLLMKICAASGGDKVMLWIYL